MRKLLLSTLFSLLLTPSLIAGTPSKKPLDEAGIILNGSCKAIASSPDGSAYVLMKDCRLLHIDVDGEITEIKVPLNKEIKTMDDYFCDMVVDTKAAYFCGYNYSAIVALDFNNPKELKTLNVKYNNNNITPLRISKSREGWTLQDDSNTYKINKGGNVEILPELSQIVLDQNDKPVISVYPYEENGKTIWPDKVLNDDKSMKWQAPAQEAPREIMGIEYLGHDADRNRDIYLVNSASGDCDGRYTLYAIDSEGNVMSKRIIPLSNIDTLMRFCKLSYDGSVIAAYADPNNPDDGIILKKFELNDCSPEELESEEQSKG